MQLGARSISTGGGFSTLFSHLNHLHETYIVWGEDASNVAVAVIPTQNKQRIVNKPMGFLGVIRTDHRDEDWSVSL